MRVEDLKLADTVSISFELRCRVYEAEDGVWSAGCPVLDVHSQGANREEAKRSLHEAVELFIESCIERNTLDEVLRDCGFRVLPSGIQAPPDAETIGVQRRLEEEELLGEEFPLEVTVPAYQAALFMERINPNLNAR